jgi:IS30 family transposase
VGERRELWERWRRGESISEIGRALDRAPGTIFTTLKEHGGIAPPERHRSRLALTLAEREEISRGIAAGESARAIARRVGRAPATICREIARHGGRARYRAAEADRRAWRNARRPQPCKLAVSPPLRDLVASKLAEDWSPEQIAGWLKLEHGEDHTGRVSHEAIYRTLFIQTRGALKRELIAHLRHAGAVRRPRAASGKSAGQGQIRDAVSIRERPAEAEDRAIPGHWEGDLLAGAQNTHVATLVERHSRFLLLVRVEGKDTRSVVGALTPQVVGLPEQLRRSLDLGPRGRARPPCAVHGRYRPESLLLRPAKPLAARLQREHERAAAPVPAERNQPLRSHTITAGRDRPEAEHETKRDTRLQDASRYPSSSVTLTS